MFKECSIGKTPSKGACANCQYSNLEDCPKGAILAWGYSNPRNSGEKR